MSELRSGDEPTTLQGGRSGPETSDAVPDGHVERGAQVGRYFIVDRLGSGGMGEVFAAYDPELDRRVALKLLRINAKRRADRARERLLREAQSLAKLSHPNVVAVYDAGTHDDRVFLAMEHIDGGTLQDWLDDHPDAEWSDAVRLMLQAGEGLCAAHRAGIVHRDFKPANVMISSDGRVRVLDFGLARRFDLGSFSQASDDADPEDLDVSAETSTSHGSLTQTGMVMGTPAYMAPEQFFAGEIDERTDQFAFCVVLFRVLFREPPFAGKTFSELGRAVERGERVTPERANRVPRAIRAAIDRGLATDPGQRFGSLPELLAQLRGALPRPERRRAGVAAAVALAAAAGGAWWLAAKDTPCSTAQEEARRLWPSADREAVSDALIASGLDHADDTAKRVGRALDDYAQQWGQDRSDACMATRVRAEQSERLMDLRMSCLEDRGRDFSAVVAMLSSADRDIARDAVDAAIALRPLDPCNDTNQLLADVPPPEDPQVAVEVARIKDELAAIRALTTAGQFRRAFELSQHSLEAARATEYGPSIAEAAVLAGVAADKLGKPDEAHGFLEEALWTAVECGDGWAEVEALTAEVSLVGTVRGNAELALRHYRHANAVLDRIGRPPELEYDLELRKGTTLFRAGRFAEAEETLRGLVAREPSTPALRRLQVYSMSVLSVVLASQGKHDESRTITDHAIELATRELGPRHPLIGQMYSNRGASKVATGDLEAGIADLERALELYEATFGPEHPEIGRLYNNLGHALNEAGRPEEGLKSLQRGIELKRRALGKDNFAVAASANNIADVLIQLDRLDEAKKYLDQAFEIWDRPEHRDKREIVFGRASMAQVLSGLGRSKDAVAEVDLALAMLAKRPEGPKLEAVVQEVAAEVTWAAGQRERAHSHAAKALAGYGRQSAHGAQMQAWIDAHPLDDAAK